MIISAPYPDRPVARRQEASRFGTTPRLANACEDSGRPSDAQLGRRCGLAQPTGAKRSASSQAVSRRRSASARAASAGAPPPAQVGARDAARGAHEAARAPGGERRRKLLHAPALRADAGQQERGVRHQLARASEMLGLGRAETAPTSLSPASPDAGGAPAARRAAATRSHTRPPPSSARSSTSAAPGLDVRTSTSTPAPLVARRRHERLDRVAAHQRVDGQRGRRPGPRAHRTVSAGRRAERARVGAGGDVDVAALAVGDHEQPGAASRARQRRRGRSARRARAPRSGRAGASPPRTPPPTASIRARQWASDRRCRRARTASSPSRAALLRAAATGRTGRGRPRARSASAARPRARRACRRMTPAGSAALHRAFRPLPGGEPGHARGGDLDALARARVDSGRAPRSLTRGTCRSPRPSTSLPRRSASSTVASTASTARAGLLLGQRGAVGDLVDQLGLRHFALLCS